MVTKYKAWLEEAIAAHKHCGSYKEHHSDGGFRCMGCNGIAVPPLGSFQGHQDLHQQHPQQLSIEEQRKREVTSMVWKIGDFTCDCYDSPDKVNLEALAEVLVELQNKNANNNPLQTEGLPEESTPEQSEVQGSSLPPESR